MKKKEKCYLCCRDEKIAVTPYSPLASGRLIRDWSVTTKRLETDQMAKFKYDGTSDKDKLIVDRVAELAKKKEVSRVAIALAWLLHKDPVVAPVVGISKIAQLEEMVEALSVTLNSEEIRFLEELYVAHEIVGFS